MFYSSAAVKSQNDLPKAEQYVKACKGSQKLTAKISELFKISRGLNVPESLHEQCVAVLGNDPDKQKKKKDKDKDKLKSIFG